jgi:hypothetical protein
LKLPQLIISIFLGLLGLTMIVNSLGNFQLSNLASIIIGLALVLIGFAGIFLYFRGKRAKKPIG